MNVYVGKSKDYTSFELLQKAYATLCGRTVTPGEIVRGKNGKPRFRDPHRPFFSLSHSGDYVVCVFHSSEVGLDIQKITRVPARVAARYLRTESTDPVERSTEWTRFESFAKMKGTGIPPEEDYTGGRFATTRELTGYIITVCTESDDGATPSLIRL